MVVVQDPSPLLWEEAYHKLVTENNNLITPPPDAPPKPAGKICRHKLGSIIKLSSSDNDTAPTRRASTRAEVVVKQEIDDDVTTAMIIDKDRGQLGQPRVGQAGEASRLPRSLTIMAMGTQRRRQQKLRRSWQPLLMGSLHRHRSSVRYLA